jgi:uroporphyrin-III C-methyltransferase/precorrin-2 dehydrogenase/sirohydrochlorin ferrochelatase
MADSAAPNLYPIFLRLRGRAVLVVGAGKIAERKIAALVASGANVLVVAPIATDAIRQWASEHVLDWAPRRFADSDADGVWLVVAATSDAEVQRKVALAAEMRRIFVLAVDDIDNATAFSGAVVRRAPLAIAISSSGQTPAMTRLIREVIEHVLPEEDWIEHAKRLRARWNATAAPIGGRFGELVRELAERVK